MWERASLSPRPLYVIQVEGYGVVRPQHCVFVPLAEAVGRQGGVGLLAD